MLCLFLGWAFGRLLSFFRPFPSVFLRWLRFLAEKTGNTIDPLYRFLQWLAIRRQIGGFGVCASVCLSPSLHIPWTSGSKRTFLHFTLSTLRTGYTILPPIKIHKSWRLNVCLLYNFFLKHEILLQCLASRACGKTCIPLWLASIGVYRIPNWCSEKTIAPLYIPWTSGSNRTFLRFTLSTLRTGDTILT